MLNILETARHTVTMKYHKELTHALLKGHKGVISNGVE